MARLTHNDYLEQFSDSGLIGGITYISWILLAIVVTIQKVRRGNDMFFSAILAGLLGWFSQNFGEFGLYIPTLAWTTFTLFGCLIGQRIIEFDNK